MEVLVSHFKKLKYFVFFVSILLSSCERQNSAFYKVKPDYLPLYKLFSATSPFNTKIPADVEIDKNSPLMVKRLMREYEEMGMLIAVKGYTVNVYFAGAETPRYDVTLLATWAPKRKLLDVPIPEYVTPDRLTDGSVAIIDTVTGCEYDFWVFKIIEGRYYAAWGNSISIHGSGSYSKGYSARGSGFALTAGVIWPQELESGKIEHALIFSYSTPRAGGPVWPATESDGFSDLLEDLPEGALVQLNPDLDLDTLDLTDYEKTIAKALQEYGMYCADSGGGIQLYVVNPESVSTDIYQGLLPDTMYVPINKIPVNQFRVIKLPPQNPDTPIVVEETGCAKFD
jgi:hypothetical protein